MTVSTIALNSQASWAARVRFVRAKVQAMAEAADRAAEGDEEGG